MSFPLYQRDFPGCTDIRFVKRRLRIYRCEKPHDKIRSGAYNGGHNVALMRVPFTSLDWCGGNMAKNSEIETRERTQRQSPRRQGETMIKIEVTSALKDALE